MDPIAVVAGPLQHASVGLSAESGGSGLVINGFWIIVAALNFILLFVILQLYAFGPISRMLAERRDRIEQGLRDAEQARQDREQAEEERLAALQEARREANDILARSQRVAQETRDADLAATRAELDRLRETATSEIDAEKQRAITDLRAEVADLALAAAGKVVGETMTDQRQRRLVEEFLSAVRGRLERVARLMARAGSAARRFAEAAFDLARRDHAEDAWATDLDLAASVVADEQAQRVIANPAIPLGLRDEVVRRLLADRIGPLALNLVLVLVRRGRVEIVPAVAREYHRLLRDERGIVAAVVTSAAPLSKDETDAVRGRIEQLSEAKVELEALVDQRLIGGLTVRVGDRLLDASVRGRLERLRSQLVTAGS